MAGMFDSLEGISPWWNSVKGVRSYAQALDLYNKTAPIRGRADDIRPLGRRRDVDKFSIRNAAEGVQFVLYNTPVLTWHKPEVRFGIDRDIELGENVTVYFGRWTSAFTARFIEWLLPNCKSVSNSQNRMIIQMEHMPDKIIMLGDDKLRFARGDDGKFYPLRDDMNKNVQWALDRTEVNRVLKIYKPFTDYVRNCLNLMREPIRPSHATVSKELITPFLTDPPSFLERHNKTVKNPKALEYIRHWQNLAMKDDAESHAEAMGMFLAQVHGVTGPWGRIRLEREGHMFVGIAKTLGELREILLRAHAEEVLVIKETKQGGVPSTKYNDWALGRAMYKDGY
jgi:hypothetical protein